MKLAAQRPGEPEIFLSIQGEGITAGQPSVFVRLSLCNLHCQWCDTDYTWNWQGTSFQHARDAEPGYRKFEKRDEIVELTVQEIVTRVSALNCRSFVFTGGEPLLQQTELAELTAALHERNRAEPHCEVETNGTLRPTEELDSLIAQYNVSPKLANSGMSPELRIKPDALTFFARNPKAVFKFVVASDDDIDEITRLQQQFEIEPQRILLMPEGTDSATLRKRSPWVVEKCLQIGYRFSDRLHVHLFGNSRGT